MSQDSPHAPPTLFTPFRLAGLLLPDATEREWTDYVYLRDNPCGPHDELWYHGAGCRSWFKVRRNTRTHEILASAAIDQPLHVDSP